MLSLALYGLCIVALALAVATHDVPSIAFGFTLLANACGLASAATMRS